MKTVRKRQKDAGRAGNVKRTEKTETQEWEGRSRGAEDVRWRHWGGYTQTDVSVVSEQAALVLDFHPSKRDQMNLPRYRSEPQSHHERGRSCLEGELRYHATSTSIVGAREVPLSER
jgi:hypothetical protein